MLALPPQLRGYSVFVTDLSTGNLAELGTRTDHLARSLHGLGLSADGHTLYVTDVADDKLLAYALRGGGMASVGSVAVGRQPVHMVETPGGAIFVTNFSGASVSVVDARTWTLRHTIAVPPSPHSIVLSPDGRWAYVACYGGAALAVLDTTSAALVTTIPLPAGAQPYGLAISRDGRYLYASDNFTGRLFVVDALARFVVGSVQVGLRPALIARSPDGASLYIANGGSHSVSLLDLAHDPAHPAIRSAVNVDGYPHGIAVTPDGRYVVVANTIGRSLSVIDPATARVVATIPAEKYPNDVLILP